MRTIAMALLVASLALAGCTSDEAPSDDQPCPTCDASDARPAYTVVAVIDSGTNPYHDHFQRAADIPDAILDRFVNALDDAAPERVALSDEGDYEARVAADKDQWDAMEQQRLYHFEGTSLLGISFGTEVPVLDDNGASHGTGTTAAVRDANPDAIVVLVEGDYAAGEAWASQQDWIDIVSMSYGPPGSVPGSAMAMGLETSKHTRTMWDAGQVPVGAADNTPSFAPNDETAGPPWVVGVAGDHPDTACREHGSGTAPDFTADFTQELPEAYSVDGYRTISGTSFSTPMTAGTFSAVLQGVRDAWGAEGRIEDALAAGPDGQRMANTDLREAFQRTATYFDLDCTSGTPVNPAFPAAQQGWGHVGPELVEATLAHLLGIEEAPPKDAETQAYMEAQMRYRETLWGAMP